MNPGGAWGLRFDDLDVPARLLVPAGPDWTSVALEVAVEVTVAGRDSSAAPGWGPDRASYSLFGGHRIEIRRDPPGVRLLLGSPTPAECVLAPHLSSAASTIAYWGGRCAMHAGAFEHDGGVWLLLGDKGDGKSSTLGWMAKAGLAVLADDLVVVDRDQVFAGPRCVDLRRDAAASLSAGRDLGIIGTRERWRIDLPPCPPSLPLRGTIQLGWGKASVSSVPAGERLGLLIEHRALALPWTNAESLLDLAARPTLSWRRPRGWETAASSIEALLAHLNGIL
ncbi:MAG: hypothetical protein ACRDNK_24835 [Solirubrobacteraceae bacterium]